MIGSVSARVQKEDVLLLITSQSLSLIIAIAPIIWTFWTFLLT